MMESMGYSLNNTERILRKVAYRYEAHMKLRAEFPHELGLLLGYPPQDVAGFILHKGKDFLYSGYWKVYGNLSESLRRFQAFDLAREQVVHMMSDGTSIRQILAFFAQENGYLYRSQQLANC